MNAGPESRIGLRLGVGDDCLEQEVDGERALLGDLEHGAEISLPCVDRLVRAIAFAPVVVLVGRNPFGHRQTVFGYGIDLSFSLCLKLSFGV